MFQNAENYNRAVLATFIDTTKNILYLVLKHPSGIGEENISLYSCFHKGEIIKYHTEIKYFILLLRLFACLCKGRNFICKISINKWFPIHILMNNIWNEELSTDLRASFLEMVMNMHVDFQPRAYIQKPEFIRTMETLDNFNFKIFFNQRHALYSLDVGHGAIKNLLYGKILRKKEVEQAYSGKKLEIASDGYSLTPSEEEIPIFNLKCQLIDHLSSLNEPQFDILLLQQLKLSNILVNFQVISTECSYYSQQKTVFNPDSSEFSSSAMDITRILLAANKIIFTGTEYSKIFINQHSDLHKDSIKIQLTKLDSDKKKASANDTFRRFSEGLRHYLSYHMSRSLDNSETNDPKILCKLELCELLLIGIDLRQDYLISNALDWFKLELEISESELQKLIPPVHRISADKKSDKDNTEFISYHRPVIESLTSLNPKIVVELITLFLCTRNYKLQTKVLEIVLRLFSQRKEFIKNLKKVKIMTLDSDPGAFMWAKLNISTLKNFTDQSEIICNYWMQNLSSVDKTREKLETLITLLGDFEEVMEVKTGTESFSSDFSAAVDEDRQIMLKNLGFHDYLLKIIKNAMHSLMHIYDDPSDEKEQEAKSKLSSLVSTCLSNLKHFVMKNPKNQQLLYKKIDTITSNLRIQLGQIDLICEIFRNNLTLCQEVPEKLIDLFIDLIVTEGRQSNFLNFFDVIVEANAEVIPRVQRIVLSKITNPLKKDVLLFMDTQGRFTFSSNLVSQTDCLDEPFAYHAKLILILSKSGLSYSSFQATRAKCQKLLSVPDIFTLLFRKQAYQKLHYPLLKFFYNIYLVPSYDIKLFDQSSEFFEFVNMKINEIKETPSTPDELNVFEAFIDIIIKVTKILQAEPSASERLEIIKNYAKALESNWDVYQSIEIPNNILEKISLIKDVFNLEIEIKIPQLYGNSSTLQSRDCKSKHKERWKVFISEFSQSLFTKLIKKEQHEFLHASKLIENTSSEFDKFTLIKAMLEYTNLSLVHKPPVDILYSVIEFLGYNLHKPEKLLKESQAQALRRTQNQLKDFGIVSIVLNLLCEKNPNNNIFSILLSLCIDLLKGGNEKVQQELYDFFITVPVSENFFETMHKFLSDFISNVSIVSESERKSSKYSNNRKIIEAIVEFLRLLCENHNEIFQNYIRVQDKSRNSYNLVGSVIMLLSVLMVKKRCEEFSLLSLSFDFLTECIQGPCKHNQKALINGNFLEITNDLLSIDEKSEGMTTFIGLSNYYKTKYMDSGVLKGWMISYLKYKCLITLLGLLEGETDNNIINTMARTLSIQVFKLNLMNIYTSYLELYKNKPYDYFLFGHFESNDNYEHTSTTNKQDLDPKYYSFIIESGFIITHLVNYFYMSQEIEIKKMLLAEFPELSVQSIDNGFGSSILGEIGNFSKGIFKIGVSAVKFLRKVSPGDLDPKDILAGAFNFFQTNTGDIEVVFKGKIFKIYFWLPPMSKYLTSEAKEDFLIKVDRSSEKAKIEYLVKKSDEFIEDMQYEEKLSKVYGYNLIATHINFCKLLVFLLSIGLNYLILTSYSVFNPDQDRLLYPSYGNLQSTSNEYNNKDQTLAAIQTIGSIHCVLSGFIFLYFLIKNVPLLVQRVWRKQESLIKQENDVKKISKYYTRGKMFLITMLLIISSIDVVYQFSFLSFSLLALIVHPFFFSIHLLDILYRFPSLQVVIMSVLQPWKSLVLTLLLIVVIVYWFSIWAYVKFYDEYLGNCDSLLMCWRTTFDQGFKMSGGIGMWIDYLGSTVDTDLYMPRFFFDDLFMIIILIAMMNIVLGLIVDTFTVIREAQEQNIADKDRKCFICGKEKIEIERLTVNSFIYHTTYEHNVWNYLHFMAYLKFKETTEYSGIESYIQNMINNGEFEWIPQQQGLSFKNRKLK
jgi:RyR and IP3R Homology associated/RIH domain/Ion transport protein